MHTISFYSYKGGVGRTLVVANVAKFLARFGRKVFAVDLDLEAPGLHYKFAPSTSKNIPMPPCGMVDYIFRFAVEGKKTEEVRKYAVRTEMNKSGGEIWLLPSGNVPSAAYWKQLAQINWHTLFYERGALGIPFFLEFKQRIENEFAPDFLLIDSRTGITEIGGIATSILPDKVVCLFMSNLENAAGTREVLRSIKRAVRLPNQKAIELVPVLTRIPAGYEDAERRIVSELKTFFNEEAKDLPSSLTIEDILVLHSEPELELAESLLVGRETGTDESLLLRDYLRLFTKLVPRDVIDPYIVPLVDEAQARAFDDPTRAQADLETLTNLYPHREAFRALLKFYRLRRSESEVMVHTAARYWEVTGETDDPLLLEIVREHFVQLDSPEEDTQGMKFVEDIWRRSGANDPGILLKLTEAYEEIDSEWKIISLIREFLATTSPTIELAVIYIRSLTTVDRTEEALTFIEQHKGLFAKDAQLFIAWAGLLLDKNDSLGVESFLAQETQGLQLLRTEQPTIYARLLQLGRKTAELDAFLTQSLQAALKAGPSPELHRVGELYDRFGRWDEFEVRLRHSLPERMVTDFLSDFRRRGRRSVAARTRF